MSNKATVGGLLLFGRKTVLQLLMYPLSKIKVQTTAQRYGSVSKKDNYLRRWVATFCWGKNILQSSVQGVQQSYHDEEWVQPVKEPVELSMFRINHGWLLRENDWCREIKFWIDRGQIAQKWYPTEKFSSANQPVAECAMMVLIGWIKAADYYDTMYLSTNSWETFLPSSTMRDD